jgi:hypothetical protein
LTVPGDALLRVREFGALTASTGIVALTGPSDSGKSYLLERAALHPDAGWSSVGDVWLNDPLDHTLLCGLGDALAVGIGSQSDVRSFRSRLRSMARPLGTGFSHEAVWLGVDWVLAGLSAGVSPDLRGGIERIRKRLDAEMPKGLSRRIEEAAGPSMRDLILVLAAEVRAFGNGIPLTLCLDRGERLSVAGVNLLRDLATGPSDGLRILVAIRTDDDDGKEVLARLERSADDIRQIPLRPFTAAELTAALPGLSHASARRLVEAHDGALPGILGGLSRGVERPQAPAESGGVDAAQSLDQLSPLTADVACCLAVFADRPSSGALRCMLGLGPGAIAQLEHELEAVGLLVPTPEGTLWFREAHRVALLEHLGGRLPHVAIWALRSLEPELAGGFDTDWVIEVDALGLVAPRLGLATPGQAIELCSLGHGARKRLSMRDVRAGARALLEAGLLTPAEDRTGAISLARVGWSGIATALARERLLRELGQSPEPRLADLVVDRDFQGEPGDAEHHQPTRRSRA